MRNFCNYLGQVITQWVLFSSSSIRVFVLCESDVRITLTLVVQMVLRSSGSKCVNHVDKVPRRLNEATNMWIWRDVSKSFSVLWAYSLFTNQSYIFSQRRADSAPGQLGRWPSIDKHKAFLRLWWWIKGNLKKTFFYFSLEFEQLISHCKLNAK